MFRNSEYVSHPQIGKMGEAASSSAEYVKKRHSLKTRTTYVLRKRAHFLRISPLFSEYMIRKIVDVLRPFFKIG